MTPTRLKQVIGRVDDLPTLPRTVLKITELINNPKSSARDLAKVITDDQILTARLLKLVNSSFYGFPQRISTVTGAIVLLGFDAIRHLLLTTSIVNLFSNKNRPLIQEELWDHSLGCAVGAKVIAGFLRYDKVEELFVAGLLHDIGKIVEMLFLPKEFTAVTDRVETQQTLMVEAERTVMGFTHQEVGHLLGERWNLPPLLIAAISHHHQPTEADPYLMETAVIHFADILCRALEIGSGGDGRIPSLDPAAWKVLGLSEDRIADIMQTMDREFSDISSALNGFSEMESQPGKFAELS